MNPQQRAMFYGYLLTQGMSEEEARKLSGMDTGVAPMIDINSQGVSTSAPQQVDYSEFRFQPTDLASQENEIYDLPFAPTEKPRDYTADEYKKMLDPRFSKMIDNIVPPPKQEEDNKYQPSNRAGNFMNMLPYLFPGGSDISTELYSLGRGIGKLTAKDSEGNRTVTGLERAGAWGNVIGGGGAALLDASRNLTSGIGFERANQYVEDWYKKKQKERPNFTNAPQFRNSNITGGISNNKYGGLFEDGGEMDETIEEGVEMASNNDQQNQIQQVAAQVAQALQQGQEPQAVMQALIQKGIPQQQAQQIIQMVMQQIQQEQGMYSEDEEEGGEEEQQEPQEKESETLMKRGGRFKYNVGDYIEFMHGGVKKAGKIKEIKNGKVFL